MADETLTSKERDNGKSSAISALLASKDPMVQLITLALIVLTGVGNFFATNKAESRNVQEVERALEEIHYIRARIDYFEARQIDMSNRIKAIDDHTVEIQEKLKRPTP